MLVNNFSPQHNQVISNVRQWARDFQTFHLYDFGSEADLHAKLIVVDREKALIGSSNLSWNGEVANYELAILIEDNNEANKIASTADRLINSNLVNKIDAH